MAAELVGLENIIDVKDVLEANLKDKKFQSELILECGGDSNITNSRQEIEVQEALQPHTNLKQLKIKGYTGTIFPDWVGHESFCNMVEVELGECGNVLMLPPLGQLSYLRRLVVWGLDSVVSIGNEFCGSSSTTRNHPFTSLEYLEFSGMKSWVEWSFSSDRLGQEGGVFPSLTELRIKRCNKLIVGLPDCHLPSLKNIHIEDCDEMVDAFICQSRQEMDTNVFPSHQSMPVEDCPRLESQLGRHSFQGNCRYGSLKKLVINNCNALKSIPLDYCLELDWITLRDCQKFESFRFSEELGSLTYLKLQNLPKFISFPEGGLCAPNLKDFYIKECKNLRSLPQEMHNLGSLEILKVEDCPEIKSFPVGGFPSTIKQLWLWKCTKLTPHNTRIEISKD